MSESVILCLVSIFSAVGIIYTLKSIFRQLSCRHEQNPCIVIGVKNHGESVEGIVRLLMKQHPSSEIMIIDYGSTDDTSTVVEKLCSDYECIHSRQYNKNQE